MPLRRFRSVEEMNEPVWREPGDPELYRAIRAVWERGLRTHPRRFTPGLRKFRSIEEMQAWTELDALQHSRRSE